VAVGIKVDISVVLKRVLKKNQISTSNCLEPGGSLKFFHPPKLGALFEKKPNIHLELSGTRRFFEVFPPTQTGGSF
jgi:hypothetical protein